MYSSCNVTCDVQSDLIGVSILAWQSVGSDLFSAVFYCESDLNADFPLGGHASF